MASFKRKDDYEYNSSNQRVGESFNYTNEQSNNLLSEDFVYKFEDNKINYTNDVGNTGLEDNGLHSNLNADKKALDNDDLQDQTSSSSSSSSASSSSSGATSSASSTAGTASTSTVAATTSGAVTTIATVATTAVVVVVGGTLTIYSQKVEKPQVVELETLEATSNSIFFSLMIGNDYEKLMSGEENDACDITVELTCESYSDFRATESILNFGHIESSFDNLLSETEYTLNIYLNSLIGIENKALGLETEYLIEPRTITTLSSVIVPDAVTFLDEDVEIFIGESYTLSYGVSPEGADNQVYWQTDDHDIIEVVDGVVTGLSAGVGTVMIQSIYDYDINDSIEILVKDVSPTAINLAENEVEMRIDDTYQIDIVSFEPSNASTSVTYSTDDNEVVTVDDEGLITAVGEGETTVTVTSTVDISVTAEVAVSVCLRAPTAISLDLPTGAESLTLTVDNSITLSWTVEPEDADPFVVWTSSDEEVAVVTEGVITGISAGTATITATSGADPDVSDSVVVEVIEPSPVLPTAIIVESEEISLDVGDTYKVEYTIEPNDATNQSVYYTVNDEEVITVDDEGLITAVGEGEASLTITCVADNSVYVDLNVYVELPAPTAVVFDSEDDITLKVGQEYEIGYSLDPEESFPDIEWTSSDGDIATVSEGIVFAKYEGTATITATSTKNPDASASITVKVEASYTLSMKKSYDPLGNLTFYGSFECSGTSLEYSEHYLYLYEQGTLPTRAPHRAGGQEENILARAYFETDISEEQPINFEFTGNFDVNGTYDWAILAYDEELQDNVMLDHGSIDLSTLEERDADPSDTLYFKKTKLMYGADCIDATYDVYVDLENTDTQYDGYALSIYGNSATTSDPICTCAIEKIREFITLEFDDSPGDLNETLRCVVIGYIESAQQTTDLYTQYVDFASIDTTEVTAVNGASYLLEQSYHDSFRTTMSLDSTIDLPYQALYINALQNEEPIIEDCQFSRGADNTYTSWDYTIQEALFGQENVTIEIYALINREAVTIYSSVESFAEEEIPYIDGCARIEEEDNRDFTESIPTGTIDFYVTLNASEGLIAEYESFEIVLEYSTTVTLTTTHPDIVPGVRTYCEAHEDLDDFVTGVNYYVYGITSDGGRVLILSEYVEMQV